VNGFPEQYKKILKSLTDWQYGSISRGLFGIKWNIIQVILSSYIILRGDELDVIWIAGGIFTLIAFGFFMEKKFGTGAPNKSDNQIMSEEIGRDTTNPNNSNNFGPY